MAAPIVVVPKKDGQIRLCGDYKVTCNPDLDVEQYPLPRPQDLFATLAGGQKFSKLDLRQAYFQLPLDEASRKFVTVNTHRGLYEYTRLPFGVASAPALFQKTMDTILQGIPGVKCYIDDILVTGVNDQEHLAESRTSIGATQSSRDASKKIKVFLSHAVVHFTSLIFLQLSMQRLQEGREVRDECTIIVN